ncbi:MAG TPA: tetratricopeptide repeat protein [Gemmatimonadales bacterium]|nr:tetratricopeptide repeat protein [Gemmatimonadales bacterium]
MTLDPLFTDDPARELRQLVEAGRFREALEAHLRAGDGGARVPEVALLAATAATRLGELGRGVTLAEAALERFRLRADTDGRMRAMNLLGAIAFDHGRLEEAERCFGEALDLARVLEDGRMAANASNNLASVAHLRNRPDLALSLYRSALLGYQRIGDRRGTAQTYHNLGLTFRQQRDWDDAEAAALQAVRHAEEVGEGSLMALAVMGRAEIHLDRGELSLARQELLRAERLCQEAGDDVGAAEVGRLRAALTLKEGRPAEALALALAARAGAVRLGILQLQGECAGVAGAAARQLGHATDADAHVAEAREIFERLGAERLQQELERSRQ